MEQYERERNGTGTKNQGMVPEPRTKELNRNQEPRNGTGTKNQETLQESRTKERYRNQNQGILPEPRTKELYQNQEPRNSTKNQERYRIQEPRKVLGALWYTLGSSLVLVELRQISEIGRLSSDSVEQTL